MIKLLPIVKLPSSSLKVKSKNVPLLNIQSSEIQALIDNMIATMYDVDGVGIAAPQVGENIRLAIITDKGEAIPIINPKIIRRSLRQDTTEEGCLSVPGLYGQVKRSLLVTIMALDRDGEEYRLSANGLTARIIQHEIDHLDGILFIDKAQKIFSVNPVVNYEPS